MGTPASVVHESLNNDKNHFKDEDEVKSQTNMLELQGISAVHNSAFYIIQLIHLNNNLKNDEYSKSDEAISKLTSECCPFYLSFLKFVALVIQRWSQSGLWKKAI